MLKAYSVLKVGDHVLFNAKNLHTSVVSAVYKTKLRSRYIGPFMVVAKKSLAYTLNLPPKLRTHPFFYVGLIKPYRDLSYVDPRALAPRTSALPRDVKSESGGQVEPQTEYDSSPVSEDGRDRLRASPDENSLSPARAGSEPKSRVDSSLRA